MCVIVGSSHFKLTILLKLNNIVFLATDVITCILVALKVKILSTTWQYTIEDNLQDLPLQKYVWAFSHEEI